MRSSTLFASFQISPGHPACQCKAVAMLSSKHAQRIHATPFTTSPRGCAKSFQTASFPQISSVVSAERQKAITRIHLI